MYSDFLNPVFRYPFAETSLMTHSHANTNALKIIMKENYLGHSIYSEFTSLWNYSDLVSMLSVNSFSGVDICGSMTD